MKIRQPKQMSFITKVATLQKKVTEKEKRFKKYLEEKIYKIAYKTNKDIYIDTIMNSFLPKHAKTILKELKDKGVIDKVPSLSYNLIVKRGKIEQIQYRKNKNE